MKAVVADPIGGPENLKFVDLPTPEPKDGEVLVKLEAIGVNFIDIYFRKGFYKAPEKPVRLGNEGAGTVVLSREGSTFKAGDRVAFAMSRGSYAEYAAIPEKSLLLLPDSISFTDAAAIVLQGMTAHYLTHSTFFLKAADTCLVHAATGGVGLLLTQIAKIIGANVIGTVGSEDKLQLAKAHGADHVINYKESDFVEEVKRLTDGKGVSVVYDSVGSMTFHNSLECIIRRGMMVSFGQSSGPVGSIDPLVLSQRGSLFLTRPSLPDYMTSPEEMRWRATDLFGWLQDGSLKLNVYKQYDLQDAAVAHRDLESRKTTGKLLLKP